MTSVYIRIFEYEYRKCSRSDEITHEWCETNLLMRGSGIRSINLQNKDHQEHECKFIIMKYPSESTQYVRMCH